VSDLQSKLQEILGVTEPQFILVFDGICYDEGAKIGATLHSNIDCAARYNLWDAKVRLAYLKSGRHDTYDRGKIQLAPSTQHE